jgi:putative ABC transport system permease protein
MNDVHAIHEINELLSAANSRYADPMATLSRDVRLAIRAILARPALSLIRVLTLVVVIAAASAVLLVANATLLRSLPFGAPQRLVRLYMQPPGTTSFEQANPLQPLVFVRVRERLPGSLEAIEGVWARDRAVAGSDDGTPDSVPSAAVSPGLFGLLGAAPILGRTFTDAEALSAERVVILSHGFWMRRYGGASQAVGSTLIIDRAPHEVIGVMPSGFMPVFVRSEFWTPLEVRDGNLINPGASFIQTVGRLRSGATGEQARAEFHALVAAMARDTDPRLKGWQAGIRDLRDAQYGAQTRPLLLLIAAIVALSFIAAANLTNLTLADVLHRRGELAIRSVLGASTSALVRPELVQCLLLALTGGVFGLWAARLILPAMVSLDPANRGLLEIVVVDWRVVLAVAVLSFGVITTAAVLPARRVAGADVAQALAGADRRTAGKRGDERLRSWLVGTQTALAVVLVSSGALLTAAFDRTARTHPGFDAAHVLTAQLRLPETAYPTAEGRSLFVEQVLARVRGIPHVIDASTTQNLFIPGFTFQTLVHVETRPTPDGQPHTVQFRRVSPGYFRTLRIPELAGRTFDERDTNQGPLTVVVSQSFAQQFWPGEDPVGKRLRRAAAGSPVMTVIGVVGDVRDVGYGQAPQAALYTVYAQGNNATAPISLVVRTSSDPRDLALAVKMAVREVDRAQPLASISTLEQFLADSLGPQRFRSVLLVLFGTVGLVLSGLGIYAVTARSVAERTREVGIRLALGGRPSRVWWTVASRSLRAFGGGLLAGSVGAAAAAALLASIFPEIEAASKLSGVAVLAALAGIGTTTALVAARRVVRVDALGALRS